eukprot:9503741-Pyramimonas_sp.AAC.1
MARVPQLAKTVKVLLFTVKPFAFPAVSAVRCTPESPRRVRGNALEGPKTGQDGPRTTQGALRRLKTAPRQPQEGANTAPAGPRRAQGGAQEGPKTTPRRPPH